MPEAAGKTVWGIHSKDDSLFLNQDLIAIGWESIGDLSQISAVRDAYREKYIAAYPGSKKGAVANAVGMLYRFACEVQVGDYMVFPSKADRMINPEWLKANIITRRGSAIPIAARSSG